MECYARRYSDQMVCSKCGLAWDANDSEPPACRPPASPAPRLSTRQQRRAQAIKHVKAILAELSTPE